MAWTPIITGLQYEDSNGNPYSGAVLKAYAAGTSTPILMATDSTGGTTVSSIALNASGYPEVSGNIVMPHVNAKYKLAFYPSQAAADANSGAIWTLDRLTIAGTLGSASQSISTSTALDSADADNYISATGTITITLPDIDVVGGGYMFLIRNDGSGLVTLDGDGAETINGAATLVLYPGDSAMVLSSTTAWHTIGSITGNRNTPVNTQIGTSYAIQATDKNKLVTFSNGSPIAATIAQAGSTFHNGWFCSVMNLGAGVLTITPTTSTINGAASISFAQNQGGLIVSDGTNYFVLHSKLPSINNLHVIGNVSGSAAVPDTVEILDEDNMSSNSATKLATQQSIKAYVDNGDSNIVQVVTANIATLVNCNVEIPQDDSIPQSGEGVEITTVSITPKSATNKLVVIANGFGAVAGGFFCAHALFKDAGANAIWANAFGHGNIGGERFPLAAQYVETAGSTSARTFKWRAGSVSTNPLQVNGDGSSNRLFGGASAATLTVMEFKA